MMEELEKELRGLQESGRILEYSGPYRLEIRNLKGKQEALEEPCYLVRYQDPETLGEDPQAFVDRFYEKGLVVLLVRDNP